MATKKEELKVNVPLEGAMAKLQTARVLLQEEGLAKTGKNDFAHFEFFQLEDFIPTVNKIFAKLGLYSHFSITPQVIDYEEMREGEVVTKKPIIREMAILEIIDVMKPESTLIYDMEVAPVMIGNNSKQNIYQAAGGRNTYYKRYLYMNALEIVEGDESDAVLGQEGVNYTQNAQQFVPNNITAPMQGNGTWTPQVSQKPMTPYDFMPQPAQNIQTTQVIQEPVNNTMLNTVANNLETVVEEVVEQDANTPLSTESKMEIMDMVNKKGLNGADIIGMFCKQNGLAGTNDLLESHKLGLIELIDNAG